MFHRWVFNMGFKLLYTKPSVTDSRNRVQNCFDALQQAGTWAATVASNVLDLGGLRGIKYHRFCCVLHSRPIEASCHRAVGSVGACRSLFEWQDVGRTQELYSKRGVDAAKCCFGSTRRKSQKIEREMLKCCFCS